MGSVYLAVARKIVKTLYLIQWSNESSQSTKTIDRKEEMSLHRNRLIRVGFVTFSTHESSLGYFKSMWPFSSELAICKCKLN